MDKDKVLRILTNLDDTEPIAEVHFDMRELEERAEAIAQAHEQEVRERLSKWEEAGRDIENQLILEVTQLRPQVAVMRELLEWDLVANQLH